MLLHSEYCKKIQEKEDLKRKNRNEYDSSSEEEDLMMKDSDDELNVHPFKIKEPAPIVMDIKVIVCCTDGREPEKVC